MTNDFAGLLARLLAAFRARSAGVGAAGADLGAGLGVDLAGGAAGRASAAASPLMFALSPAGAARSSDMSAAAPQAVQTDPAPVPEATPTSAPISSSDRVRSGISAPFSEAHLADPAAARSAGKVDVLAQLSDTRVSPETIKLARSLGNLIGDAHPQLPSPPPTMALPRGRARPVPPPKPAPRTTSHRALALTGARDRLQPRQLQQLLRKLLGARAD
jgi:hypothetical protein